MASVTGGNGNDIIESTNPPPALDGCSGPVSVPVVVHQKSHAFSRSSAHAIAVLAWIARLFGFRS